MSVSIRKYGKNSIQIYETGKCIENSANIPKELSSPDYIAKYIISKY